MPPKVGYLRKKGKYYYYTFYFHNKRYCDIATKETSERSASKSADQIYTDYKNNYVEETLSITCKEYFKSYVNRYKSRDDISNASKYEVELILIKHVSPSIGDIPLNKLKNYHLEDYYLNAPQSRNTLAKHHRIIKKALNDAVRYELISSNPADNAEHPKQGKSTVGRSLSPKDAKKYLTLLKDQKNEPKRKFNETFFICAILALLGGMRREEVCGLTWNKVSYVTINRQEFTLIRIDSAITTVVGTIEIGETKTINSKREIYLPPIATPYIKKHYEIFLENKERLGDLHTGNYVISYDNGEYVDPNLLTRTNKYLLKKYGLPEVRFHDLRHSHASLLLAMGVDLKVISSRLGHSNINITADTYVHTDKSLDANAALAFSDIFSSNM